MVQKSKFTKGYLQKESLLEVSFLHILRDGLWRCASKYIQLCTDAFSTLLCILETAT